MTLEHYILLCADHGFSTKLIATLGADYRKNIDSMTMIMSGKNNTEVQFFKEPDGRFIAPLTNPENKKSLSFLTR